MSAFNDYLEQALRDHYKNGTQLPLDNTYLGLFTSDPGETGSTANEVTGANYSRQQVFTTGAATTPRWTSAATGTGIENAQTITWNTATTSWGMISHVGVLTGTTGTGNNMLFHGTLTSAKTIGSNDQFKMNAGDAQITFD